MRSRLGITLFLTAGLALPGACADGSFAPIARNLAAAIGVQGRLMWVDGSANVFRTVVQDGKKVQVDYTTTREGVQDIVDKCKAAHINTIVVDIKPLSGQTLYPSAYAPRMRVWKGRPVPDFDVLGAFVEAGHRAGLQVDACINALSEGHKFFQVGPAYEHPDWQSIVYTVDRGLIAPDNSRLQVHVGGEPSDASSPTLLSSSGTILGGDPSSGLVGLESTEKSGGIVTGSQGSQVGRQLNLVLDANSTVTGVIDSALLGDDPLVAPEDGRLLPAARAADREWIGEHLKPGDHVRFDMKTAFTRIADAPSERVACFVNALHPEARQHELDLVREIVTKYEVDGLVLDRCRYSNLYNDFSDRSRQAFEAWMHRPVQQWPADVFAFSPRAGEPLIQGPLYEKWLEFRAHVIRDFTGDVARVARAARPNVILGTYVGSWYPSYFEVGVNWGSQRTPIRYSWFTPTYTQTGYADFFDWVSTGCYYPVATREEARQEGAGEHATVEYAAELSNLAVANGAFVYSGIYVPDFAGKPEAMIRALEAGGRQSQGWMIFDISYVNDFNWWPYLEKAFAHEAAPPDTAPGLLQRVRAAADTIR